MAEKLFEEENELTLVERFVIKDVRRNMYYWSYRIDDGWSNDIADARLFQKYEDALQRMREEYMGQTAPNTFLQIEKVFIVE